MSRPCDCDRLPPAGKPYTTEYCRLCWLYHHDEQFRAMWGNGPPLARRDSIQAQMPRRLGDMVGDALKKIGITEERVSRWLGRPCGCKERREKINALHTWASKVIFGETDKAEQSLDDMISHP